MALSISVAGSLKLIVGGASSLGTSGSPLILTASGGTAPFRFEAHGDLPPGMGLSSDGRITGQPSASGTALVRVRCTDSGSPMLFVDSDVSLVIS